MLLVNYWDSTMGVMPVLKDGSIKPLKTLTQPERKIDKVSHEKPYFVSKTMQRRRDCCHHPHSN